MNKTQAIKRLIPEIVIIIAGCAIFGVYALLVWGKQKPIKVYAGQWIENTRKIDDFYSVGYLEVIGK